MSGIYIHASSAANLLFCDGPETITNCTVTAGCGKVFTPSLLKKETLDVIAATMVVGLASINLSF